MVTPSSQEGTSGDGHPPHREGEGRRRAEGAGGLEDLVAIFRELEASAPDGFMALGPIRAEESGRILDFQCIYLNPAAERMLGSFPTDPGGRCSLREMACDQDSDLFRACCRVVETGEPAVLEVRDGLDSRSWLRISLARCRNGLSARLYDITRQKEVEQERSENDLRYRLVSQATSDVLWDWDLERRTISWGQAIHTVLGYARDEVEGTLDWWRDRIHPDDRERVLKGLERALSGASDAWSDEYRFRRADGTYAFYFDRGFFVRNVQGRSYRMLGSMVDLSERLRAEEVLLESEERFRAIFTQAAVGLALLSPGGALLKTNQRLCDILGTRCDDLLGSTLGQIAHPDDVQNVLHQLHRLLTGELKSDSIELRCVRGDGTTVWVNLTLSLVREASGAPKWFVAIVEDIQERKRLEEEARRTQEFESRLHGIVGHDIRSPLAAIKASVSVLLLKPDLPEAHRRTVARIARSTDRIQRLVQQLLDYTRIRVGAGLPIYPKATDLYELCRRVMEEFNQTHPGRVALRRSGADGRGMWDPDRLMQLLSNLVENALKYGSEEVPVTVTVEGDPDDVELRVHNTGEPIPPGLVPTLFEPFRLGAQNEQTVKVSLGLGLYVVREVVRAHGGTVDVRSSQGEGTTLIVRLPRHSSARVPQDSAPTVH